jgi:hypothetical protein
VSRAPLALKLHALLVLGAALVAPDHDAGGWWAGVVFVGLTVSWVLLGSRFGWWVQAVALAGALTGILGVWWSYGDGTRSLRVFVPPVTLTALTLMLVGAAALLLLPGTRAFCSNRSDGPRSSAGIAFGALFMAWFPAVGLSVESRLPSDGEAQRTSDLEFVGHDDGAPTAFYLGRSDGDHCLLALEPRATSRSCQRRLGLDYLEMHTGHLVAWALPKRVAGVTVVYPGGATREARLLNASDQANVFYTTESPHEARGIRAYDASGEKLVGCRYC